MSRVFSIDDDGMKNAWTTNVLSISAMTRAITISTGSSRKKAPPRGLLFPESSGPASAPSAPLPTAVREVRRPATPTRSRAPPSSAVSVPSEPARMYLKSSSPPSTADSDPSSGIFRIRRTAESNLACPLPRSGRGSRCRGPRASPEEQSPATRGRLALAGRLAPFLDPGRLAPQRAQVVKLGPADPAAGHDLHLVVRPRVDR